MKTPLLLRSVALLVLISVAPMQPADAAIGLKFEPFATQVVSGGQVNVALILVDADGDVDADGGLFGGGGRILVDDSSSAAASIVSAAQIVPNSGFSSGITIFPFQQPFPSTSPTGFSQLAGFVGVSDFFNPVATTGGQIRLAEFTITITGAPGTLLNLEPATLGGSFQGNTGFNSNANFDAGPVNTFGTQIRVVPEPSSMTVLGCMVFSIVVTSRRRKLEKLPKKRVSLR